MYDKYDKVLINYSYQNDIQAVNLFIYAGLYIGKANN